MKNGDRLTGNVKRLEGGVLYIETAYSASSVAVDWEQVDSIESKGYFEVVLVNGKRLNGRIQRLSANSAASKNFIVREQLGEVRLSSNKVVNIESQKGTFWRQLRGSVDAGYSCTSGTTQTALNVDAKASYLSTGWESSAVFTSSFGGEAGSSRSNTEDGQAIGTVFLNRNSFLAGLADFLHSTQQELSLRTTLGGGYGRYLIRGSDTTFEWLGGFAYTNETFTTPAEPRNQNAEALFGLEYHWFRFNIGSIESQVLLFPGVSDAGRIRVTTNNSLTIKLANNFSYILSVWDNFDSHPPGSAKKNGLGVSSSIGYSF